MVFAIQRGAIIKAKKVVVYGPEGIGKTSFAADFPRPVFIDTEGGSSAYDLARLPRPTSWTMLRQEIEQIISDKTSCSTLVIDTIDWAEQLCISHVCATHQVNSIEDISYGKGYVYVIEEFGRLLNRLSDLVDLGVNVVLTAHCLIRKFEQPDELGTYDRYELKLGQKAGSKVSALVKEWSDMLLFANYKTLVTVDAKTKKAKAAGGQRVMYTTHHPNWDAKNRCDLAEELPFNYESIRVVVERDPQEVKEADAAAVAEQAQQTKQAEIPQALASPPQRKGGLPRKPTIAPMPPVHAPQATAVAEEIPPKLLELMQDSEVTAAEIHRIVAIKGYYPAAMPIMSYDPQFIEGCLIGAWDQVFEGIRALREQDKIEVPF